MTGDIRGRRAHRSVAMLVSNPAVNDPRVHKEARALARAGYEVTIVAWDRRCDSAGSEEVDGFRVVRIPVRSTYGAGLFQIPALLTYCVRAASLVRRLRPAVIHCHDLETLPAGVVISKTLGCRLVFDAHEPNYFADARRFRRLMIWTGRLAERLLARKADAVLVTNDYQVGKYEGMNAPVVRLVPNYPEEKLLRRAERIVLGSPPAARAAGGSGTSAQSLAAGGRASSGVAVADGVGDGLPGGGAGTRSSAATLTIGRIGALYYDMGIEELVEAYATLRREIPGLRLMLVGQATGKYRETLREMFAGFRDGVVLRGGYRYDELPALYRELDVCVMPQKKTEWFEHITPTKFFEALCFGKPVVTTDIGGIGRVVAETQCGVVLRDVTAEEICAALRPVLNDAAARRAMGLRGFMAVKRRYNWAASVQNLLRTYGDLVGGEPDDEGGTASESALEDGGTVL